jgi:multimeric flavodoxin WrbA
MKNAIIRAGIFKSLRQQDKTDIQPLGDCMDQIIAIYGSPRRDGNSAALLKEAVAGARQEGAHVEEVFLRDFKISPCLEIYACIKTGECAIRDDFPDILAKLEASSGIMLASPIFFYTVSAHTKIFMDRCQSLWVRKYWIEKQAFGKTPETRKGLFISVGATEGKKLFDGAMLTVKYFFDVLNAGLWRTVLCRGVDRKGEIEKREDYLKEAFQAGRDLARALQEKRDKQ